MGVDEDRGWRAVSLAEMMTVALLVMMAAVLASLVWRHRMAGSPINLEDLLLGPDGRISKSATILFGAFFLSSWVVAYQSLASTLSDATFAAYLAAWVTPTIAHLFKRSPDGRRDDPSEQAT